MQCNLCSTVLVILLFGFGLFFPSSSRTQDVNHFFGSPEFDRINVIIPDESEGYYVGGSSDIQDATEGWLQYFKADQVETRITNLIEQQSAFSSSLIFDLLRLSNGDLIAIGSGLPKSQMELPKAEQKDDGWAIRLTPKGRIIWSRIYSSELHERFYFVTSLTNGTLLVGGRAETKKKTGRSNGVSYIIDSKTGRYLHRKEWGKNIRRSAFYDSLALPSGGYMLVGWATNSETKKDDVWVVNVKPTHDEHWSKIWGDKGDDLGYRAVREENGNITVFGWGTRRNAQYTSGLVLRLKPNGDVDGSTFLDVGEVGHDKFLAGVSLPGEGYVAAGEASISPKRYRGKAWVVMLNKSLKKVDEKHLNIRGSRFTGIVPNPDNMVVAAGYGIPPGETHVDAWITEVFLKSRSSTAKVAVIERIQVTYSKNSITQPGWYRGYKDLNGKTFENMVRSTLVNHATKVFESAGYTVLVEQVGRSFQDDLLILSISVSVNRAFVEPCLPGKESDDCLPGIDPREAGGIWDPKKREFIVLDLVIAEKLEFTCELKRKGTKEMVWSNHLSMFPCDETGPIPVAKKDVDRLAEKAFEGYPIRKDVVLVPTYKELADAVFYGDIKKTKGLLENGASLETKSFDRTRPTLLMGAALNGDKEIAQLLIKYGADIDAQATNDMTPLRLAAGKGHFGVVKVLLEAGANVDPDATDKITPLYMATQNGHTDVVRLLLEYRARVNQKASSGSTPLFVAAQEGYIEIFEMLVKKGADLRVRRDDGVPIWIPVAQQGQVDIMKALIKMGVNVVKRDDESGVSALYMAAQGDPHGTDDRQAYRELVTLLLNEGADIDEQIFENMTPLLVAIQEQNFDIASILIERGADVNSTRTGGISALMMASYHGHANTVKKLLANMADIGAKDSDGQTALDYALINDHGDIVKILRGSQK